MKIKKYGLMLLAGFIMMSGCKNTNLHKANNAQNEYFTPAGERLTPAGKLIKYGTPDTEQHAMDVKLSPDGKILAVEGRFNLVLIDTKTNKVIKQIDLTKKKIKGFAGNTYSGIIFSKDGKHIYWTGGSNFWGSGEGYIFKANLADLMNSNDGSIEIFHTFEGKTHTPSIPNDIKLSKDGKYMYVTLNGANKVAKIDMSTKKLVWEKGTNGNFPYGLTIAANKIFVTNWGGDLVDVNNSDKNTISKGGWNDETSGYIKINSKTESAASGTVTVMDKEGNIERIVNVGLHPNDIISNKDGSKVYVANANSDTVSIIDTDTYEVETVIVSPEKIPYGFSPDALKLSPDEKFLFVADGNTNCVSVIDLNSYQTIGFIPTGAYPGGLDISKDAKTLYVADMEGIYSRATTQDNNDTHFQLNYPQKGRKNISTAGYFNTHRELAYVSAINLPELESEDLEDWTNQVKANIEYKKIKKAVEESMLSPRKDVKAVPVPKRLGEPSVFKHVIYIIKENRTYDQILGDMKEGNGDAYLTVFGKKVTPNMHKLASEFGLLDNFYDVGKCSAEGHPWADGAFVSDYVEKNVRSWFRGYPHNILDAMVSPKTGYIWDDVLSHGLTFINYGETVNGETVNGHGHKDTSWTKLYNDYKNGNSISFTNYLSLNNLAKYTSDTYPGYFHHEIPDQVRANAFIKDIKNATDSNFPNFAIMALPADHTAGLKPGFPTPAAMVADNDLALGRIVEAVSKSPIWKDTVIFVIEDDTQNGWDHVSSYRGPAWVISPYSKKHQVIHKVYSQLSVLHTMERILGIPSMNINDMSAPIMYDCFTDKPDFTPYTHVENQIPLDNMNPKPVNQ
jgi:YVTN family beta-propeller protein